jgi:glycosyltransferase involved in cell wall biosynthesis
MRVIWINKYSSFIGGCEWYIYNTAKALKAKGISSTLFFDPSQTVDPEFLHAFDHAYPITELFCLYGDIIFVHQCEDEIVEKLIEMPIPAVRFFHDYHLFCLSGHKMIPFTNRPCERPMSCRCYPLMLWPVRADNFFGFTIRTIWGLRSSQRLNRKLTAFVVASQYMANEVIANEFDKERVHVLYPFAPKVELKSRVVRDMNMILYVGQLIRTKGVDIAIRALKYLDEKYHLVIVGSGKQESELRNLASAYGLSKRVTFTGFLSQEDCAPLYAEAAVSVVPSRYPENFGLVGPEAMRFGTPVIGAKVGGIPEWCEDGKTGLLVPPNDPQELATAVKRIVTDPALWKEMSEQAKKRYEECWTPEKHVEGLAALFESVSRLKCPRYTVYGSEKMESSVKELLQDIVEGVKGVLLDSKLRALLLIGGYGKGEGGIEKTPEGERLHNNLDFLCITRGNVSVKEKIKEIIAPLCKIYNIGCDISEISDLKLQSSPTHLIWYEMYHGHKLLLGDADFVEGLPFSDLKDVPWGDIYDLMVNRGTLLVINRWILESYPEPNEEQSRILIKHAMKAIIGLGDAYLFFMGGYHWSYRERLIRIRNSHDIPQSVKDLYTMAMEFRLRPNYNAIDIGKVRDWMEETLSLYKEFFLQFEGKRLGISDLSWENYSSVFLSRSTFSNMGSGSGWWRKAKGIFSMPKVSVGESWREKCGFVLLSPSERLGFVFPFVAFDLDGVQEIAPFLGVKETENLEQELHRHYLTMWGEVGDVNFTRSLQEWGLSLNAK